MLLRKFTLSILVGVLFIAPAFAQISGNAVFEVRTTGSNTNGGCFDSTVTSPGTDYSQQDAAQVAFTDLVIGATTTQLTSAANPFTSAYVGNCIYISGGTGFTVGWYEILSVSGSTATMDRSVGTAASTGGTGNLGGALADYYPPFISTSSGLGGAATFWVKAGTYTRTAQQVLSGTGGTSHYLVVGYQTTRGDNGTHPLFTTSTNSVDLIHTNNLSLVFSVKNIDFSNTAASRYYLINRGGNDPFGYVIIENSTMTGFSTPIQLQSVLLRNVTITGSTNVAIYSSSLSTTLIDCIIENGSNDAIYTDSTVDSVTAIRTIFYNNSGYAVNFSWSGFRGSLTLINSAIVSNTAGGVYISGFNQVGAQINNVQLENNIFYGNGTYGISMPTGLGAWTYINNHNAYGANTTGARNGLPVGVGDVTLTANPFTNPASGDFSLNNTAGGGALLRGAGFPGQINGLSTTTGYVDIGAFQHLDSGTGSGASNYGSTR